MRALLVTLLILTGWLTVATLPASAKPFAPRLLCAANPDLPACSGKTPSCSFCHLSVPPALNPFGAALLQATTDTGVELTDDESAIKALFDHAANLDSDGDGTVNGQELAAGSLPGSRTSQPAADLCGQADGCPYDYDYAFKKIWLGVCGEPPAYDDYLTFTRLSVEQKVSALDTQLDDCLQTDHWRGKDGVIWEIGHYKIRPMGNLKLGEDAGQIPAVDYYADYNLFVYSQIDGHDAREQLLADYSVERTVSGDVSTYAKLPVARLTDGQVMQPERRVGLLTSFWNFSVYLNYTGVARVLVAQAFNAYLGINLAVMQGLNPVNPDESKFRDYDLKGVEQPACAACHTTIDPLAYPFRNYNGLTGTTAILGGQNAPLLQDVRKLGDEENLTPLSYALPRLDYLEQTIPGIKDMPEAGYIFGKRVENLNEWAEVLVNSDEFAANSVRDYWKVLIGSDPSLRGQAEFQQLWKDFKGKHEFSVEAMLHDMIKTAAYGTP